MQYVGKTFLFFFKNYTKSTIVVVLLLFLAGIAEAVGIAAFLPFLQLFLDGGKAVSIPYEPIDTFLKKTGIILNYTNISLFIVTLISLKAAILWLAMRKVSKTVAIVSTDFRNRFLQCLLQANWRYFTGHSLGKSLNSIATETFRGSLTFVSITRFTAYCIQFLVYIASAFILSWQVTLGILGVGCITALILWSFVRIARRSGQQQTDSIKGMISQMGDVLQGIKPLRAMALEKKFMDVLHRHSKDLEKAQIDQLLSTQSLRIFHEPIMATSTIAGLYVAMKIGDLSSSSLILMALLFIRSMTGLNSAQSEYQRLTHEESALWSLMDTIEEIEQAAELDTGQKDPPKNLKTVAFEDVNFSHGEKPVLKNANLDFQRHQLTALIGQSGSGKTTVLDLLSGFFRPDTGAVMVNGENLNEIRLKDWRQSIGFVPQEVFLFNDSIMENIVMGRSGISEQDVWDALEAVGAKDFVSALPGDIHAPVGENGRMLSGGQRQRISIARAIVHHPQILLLDEATSALDQETEKVLLRTLKELAKDMAVVLVTHNQNVIDYADVIYEI